MADADPAEGEHAVAAATCEICGTTYEPRPAPLTRTVKASSVTGGNTGEPPGCPACQEDLEHLNRLFYDATDGFGFCGCGCPGDAYNLVRAILDLMPLYQNWESGRSNGKMAQEVLGGHDGVFYLVLYSIDRTGLTEHGTSVGGSWLTAKGEHYLALMKRHEWDAIETVGLPHGGDGCPPDCRNWLASCEEWERRRILEARQ